MKPSKIKTHVLWVSPRFPFDHPRKGEATYFVEKIQLAINELVQMPDYLLIDLDPKLHTCRINYESWKRKIDEVNRGEAILSLRMWSASPYNKLHDGSHPIEIAQFNKDSGIDVQKLTFNKGDKNKPVFIYPIINDRPYIEDINLLAENDGLFLRDFKSWFRKADLSKPMAIIHFTKFRY